jgi:hypothetical protein
VSTGKDIVTMPVTNTADVVVEPTMVESLEEAAFILEEDPNASILIVPKGTLAAMLESVQL